MSLMCKIFGCKLVIKEHYPLGYHPSVRYRYFNKCLRCGKTHE